MSSREIATLCDKEHRNVCRDIDNLNATYAEMGLLKIEQGYYTIPSTGNQQHREFYLTKEQCVDLISGYRTEIRIRINQSQLLSHVFVAMNQLEMLQIMVKKADDALNAYSIQDYAYILDGSIENLSSALSQFEESVNQ